MSDRGTLADRLRQIADDLATSNHGRSMGTHSGACWQWHESCALHRAADLLDGQPQDRPAQCPSNCWDGMTTETGRGSDGFVPCPDPWHVGGSGDTR